MVRTVDEQGREVEDDVIIERQIDLNDLKWPFAAIASGEDGESFNRAYTDLRGLTWTDAKRTLKLEKETLSATDYVLDAAEEVVSGDDDLHEQIYGLDIGVASTVVALSAARCVTITSCNGAPGHNESYPLVAFRCRKARAPDILLAAEEAGCGLHPGLDGTLVVYAGNVSTLMRFAEALIDTRKKFGLLRSVMPSRRTKEGLIPDTSQLSLFEKPSH